MNHSRSIRRKRRLRKLRRFFLIFVGVVFIAWIFYVGATWGPRAVDAEPRRSADPLNPELAEESKRLEREFEAIAATREPMEQDLNVLREAIAKQRDYNQRRPAPEDRRRLEDLENRLDHFLAKEIHTESQAAEKDAERLLAEGKVTEAVESVQRALDFQREINRRFGRGAFRNTTRESILQQRAASMEAEPLYARSLELQKQGEQAAAAFQWEDARRHFTEARELQNQVNEHARRSAYYNPARLQQLGDQIGLLRVGEMMSEVLDLQQKGKAQEQNGQWEQAAQMFERAMVLQNTIDRDHPQSPFVSPERVRELDADRQTALSARQGIEFEKVVGEMRQALTTSNYAAARQNLETAHRLLAQLFDRFPHSRYADFNVRLEIEFLGLVQEVLPDLQKLLREDLLPIPGKEGWQMSSGPVSQRVYARVMSANPSRNLGDDLPVDSVTLNRAREFCRRASWILARPVQLPGRAHFEAALGEWDPEVYSALSWHKENSGGNSHPIATGAPNSHGFFHLVGNLRLWLDEEATENGALWTAGASYAEEFPSKELFQEIGSDRRDPTVGFRYVVGPAM